MANSELLQQVLQHIKEHPEEHDAKRWHRDFAGWTLRLAVPGVELRSDDVGAETLYDADGERVWSTDIGLRAQTLLGLSDDQAFRLFCGGNSIDDLSTIVAEFTAGEVVSA
jgi:hypothetical protein